MVYPIQDTVTYRGIHVRLKNWRGKASDGPCVDCGKVAAEWSYDGTDPDELVSEKGRPYSLDLNRYSRRCLSCHRRKDAGDVCKNGHPRTEETTYITPAGWRLCRPCRTESVRRFRASHSTKEK